MKTLVFDVMLDGRFIHTFRYQYCPLFPIDEQELEKFVTDRLCAAVGKVINADVNGALNIGRKVFGDSFVIADSVPNELTF